MNKYYLEFRCRKCSNPMEHHMRDEEGYFNYSDFINICDRYIKRPPLFGCKQCKKYTIHDLVSHSRLLHGKVVEYNENEP